MKTGLAAALVVALVSGTALAEPFIGPSGQTIQQSKCRVSSSGCYQEARATCKGPYQIVDSESHAGGIIADIMPGPITWYSMSYVCGKSDGRLATFPFQGPSGAVGGGSITCHRVGYTTTCY